MKIKTDFESVKEEFINILSYSSRFKPPFKSPIFENYEMEEVTFVKKCKTFDELIDNINEELERYLKFIDATNEFIERVNKCKELPSPPTEPHIEIECFLKDEKRIIKIIYNEQLFPEAYEYVNVIVNFFEANNVPFKEDCLNLKEWISKREENVKTAKDIVYAVFSLHLLLRSFCCLKQEFFEFLEEIDTLELQDDTETNK